MTDKEMDPQDPVLYTVGEEIANSITHGIGTLLSLGGLIFLITLTILRGGFWEILSFTVYGCSLVLLYLSSTLYHGIQHRRIKHYFRKLDYAAIFVLIAGTYTPFLLIYMRQSLGGWYIAAVWGFAIAGISLTLLTNKRGAWAWVSAYVGMSFLFVFAWQEMMTIIPPYALTWLFIGGAFYLSGIFFLLFHRMPYNHAVWHLFVMGGSLAHFWAVLNLAPEMFI